MQIICKINEMVYQDTRQTSILAMGEHRGMPFAVLSIGTHPCGYICIPKDDPRYQHIDNSNYYWNIEEDFYPDNEITYCEHYLKLVDPDGKYGLWVGWDHAHASDLLGSRYGGLFGFRTGKAWTTDELIDECIEAINVWKEKGESNEH